MRLRDLEIVVDRRDVAVHEAGVVIATARWSGRSLGGRSGSLAAEIWQELELAILADEERAIEAATASAYDESGEDLTLIDWMLTLTPSERLRVLVRHASGLARFVRQ